MNSSLLFLLCFLVAGLVVLLARENRLRRALQALCGRLASRVAALTEKAQSQSFSALNEHPARPFNTTSNLHPSTSTSTSSPPANNHDPIQHQQHQQHQTSATRHRPFQNLRPLSQRPYRLSRFFKRRRHKHRRSHSRQQHQHHHQQQYQEKHQRRN
jgi:hypothetical protein